MNSIVNGFMNQVFIKLFFVAIAIGVSFQPSGVASQRANEDRHQEGRFFESKDVFLNGRLTVERVGGPNSVPTLTITDSAGPSVDSQVWDWHERQWRSNPKSGEAWSDEILSGEGSPLEPLQIRIQANSSGQWTELRKLRADTIKLITPYLEKFCLENKAQKAIKSLPWPFERSFDGTHWKWPFPEHSNLDSDIRIDPIERERRTFEKPTLIAVHQDGEWARTRPDGPDCRPYLQESDQIIIHMHELELPVVYLMGGSSEYCDWKTGGKMDPTAAVYSMSGGHTLRLKTADAVMIGGNWELCHARATVHAIRSYFEKSRAPFTIHLPVKAIHQYQPQSVTPDQFQVLAEHLRSLQNSGNANDQVDAVEKAFITGDFMPRSEEIRDLWQPSLYTFEIFVDGRHKKTVGEGSRHVQFKVWNKFNPREVFGYTQADSLP